MAARWHRRRVRKVAEGGAVAGHARPSLERRLRRRQHLQPETVITRAEEAQSQFPLRGEERGPSVPKMSLPAPPSYPRQSETRLRLSEAGFLFSGRRLDRRRRSWALGLETRHPLEPPRQVPVPAAEQLHGARENDRPDDR